GLPISLGLHPWYVNEPWSEIAAVVLRERPTAVGECGLDGEDRDPNIPPLESQRSVFEQQLDLAEQLSLPVTVHSRKAVNDVVELAAHFPRVRGVLHAFSGSLEQIRPLLERGWMVGVGGAVTRPGARRIRKLATQVDLSMLLLETDAPAIGLEGVRPPLVRPHHLLAVARALAELRGLDTEEVASITDANARRMFGDSALIPLAV
ncbi:MAG TPA: TatD family hydrolase, partial [Polyangiaceae bacterium]|nr:TatD family hydrolase [Polyangiaceae bacterium]